MYDWCIAEADKPYAVWVLGAMSFAGNHCLDYGTDAFLDTLHHAQEAGIAICGAGRQKSGLRETIHAQPRISPAFDLGSADHALGLMRIEGAGAGAPALRQDLHRKQFGIDLRLERPGRSGRAIRAGDGL